MGKALFTGMVAAAAAGALMRASVGGILERAAGRRRETGDSSGFIYVFVCADAAITGGSRG
jgi:hypothetical protein